MFESLKIVQIKFKFEFEKIDVWPIPNVHLLQPVGEPPNSTWSMVTVLFDSIQGTEN